MKSGILKDSILFSLSRYFILGLTFARNLFIARFLGPSEYGIWVIVTLILTYGDQVHFGLRHAGDKEIPYYRGQNKDSRWIANTIYAGILALSVVFFLLSLGISFFLEKRISEQLFYGIQIAGLIVIADQLNRFCLMILRANQEFQFSSKLESLFELIRTILVCASVLIAKFYGALIMMFLASWMLALFLVLRYRDEYHPRFDLPKLRQLFGVGLPLFLGGLLYILIISIDRLVGSFALAPADLGLYGMAALLATAPIGVSQAVGAVILPYLSEQFGKTGDSRQMRSFFTSTLLSVAYLVPILVSVVLFFAPPFLRWFLPAYAGVIPTVFILVHGVYFLSLVQIPISFLGSTANYRSYISGEVVSIVLAVVCYGVSLSLLKGLQAIAVVAALSFFTYTTTLLYLCYQTLRLDSSSLVKTISGIYAPLLYGMIIVDVLYYFFPALISMSLRQLFGHSFLQILVFLICYSPILYLFNRKTDFAQRLNLSFFSTRGKVL